MTPPVFGHGHLRLYLLSVLETRPMHGYEIIQAISDRFGGTYVPSAGTIYPRLAKLEAEGLVSKSDDGGRRTVYTLTDAGRAELDARRDELDAIEDGVGDSVRRLADEVRASVSDAMASLRAELAAAAREARDEARNAAKAAGGAARNASAGYQRGWTPDDEGARDGADATETRAEGRAQLARAEGLLAEFRQDIRADLRRAVATGLPLDAAAVDQLQSSLAEVRAALARAVGAPE
ncbi:MAG TPA: PadR family transcriptional regulator [Microcella sp.]|nr:PadR family transcriptional regulator [Microcella sp.]